MGSTFRETVPTPLPPLPDIFSPSIYDDFFFERNTDMFPLDSVNVWHVSKAGNDANTGHAAQYPVDLSADAKLTIGAAVLAASSGDTIVIWPGTYAENVDASSKSLNIVGTNRDLCKIAVASGSYALSLGGNASVSNLSCINTDPSGQGIIFSSDGSLVMSFVVASGPGDGLNSHATNIILKNCDFYSTYDAVNFNSADKILCSSCRFILTGSNTLMRAAASVAGGVFSNCVFYISGGSAATGYVHCIFSDRVGMRGEVVFSGCRFLINLNATVASVVACVKCTYSSGDFLFSGCFFRTIAVGASGGAKDFIVTAGRVTVKGCSYDTTKVTGDLL